MRIYEMITKEKMLWSAIKFSQLILKGNVWRSVWRICMWILGLEGLKKKLGATPKWLIKVHHWLQNRSLHFQPIKCQSAWYDGTRFAASSLLEFWTLARLISLAISYENNMFFPFFFFFFRKQIFNAFALAYPCFEWILEDFRNGLWLT